MLEDRRTLWVIASVVVLLFSIANLPWQLDDYDQAKQAFTSFEMIKEGHWLYQHTPREHVATKPPLIGWISSGLFSVTKSWDLAWRLPSFLAAIALSILLFRSSNSVYGSIAGLIAFSAFGLNLLSPRLATLVRTDMPLALVIFLIGLLIWQKIRTETEWGPRDRIYIFALLTAAMLIKGPIVYAFLLPGVVLFQWFAFKERRLGQPSVSNVTAGKPSLLVSAWSGWWPWIASLAIFLLWVTGGILFQPGFFDQVVMREFLGRFGETIHRPQPLYFYVLHLLHKFAPWSVLMIAVAIVDLRSQNWRLRSVFQAMSPETFWLLCWIVGGLIAMSLIPSKRVDRIFPVIPPLCLLLAAQIRSVGTRRFPARSDGFPAVACEIDGCPSRRSLNADAAARISCVIALVFAILFTGGYTIWKVVSGYLNHRDALVVFAREVRHEAEAHHWRYEVVSAKDEGLLLYLRKTHFISANRAIAQWNRGNLDALVAPSDKAPALMRELHDAALSQLKSNERKEEQGRGYVLITH